MARLRVDTALSAWKSNCVEPFRAWIRRATSADALAAGRMLIRDAILEEELDRITLAGLFETPDQSAALGALLELTAFADRRPALYRVSMEATTPSPLLDFMLDRAHRENGTPVSHHSSFQVTFSSREMSPYSEELEITVPGVQGGGGRRPVDPDPVLEAWFDLARELDWEFSYVREEDAYPEEISGRPWMPAAEWQDWNEPFRTSYREYVTNQSSKESSVQSVRELVGRLDDLKKLDPSWLNGLKLHAATLPLAEFAAVIGNLRAARFGRHSAWRNTALLGALDELRHTQIPLQLMHELVRVDGQFDWTHHGSLFGRGDRAGGLPPGRDPTRTGRRWSVASRLDGCAHRDGDPGYARQSGGARGVDRSVATAGLERGVGSGVVLRPAGGCVKIQAEIRLPGVPRRPSAAHDCKRV